MPTFKFSPKLMLTLYALGIEYFNPRHCSRLNNLSMNSTFIISVILCSTNTFVRFVVVSRQKYLITNKLTCIKCDIN